MKNILLAGVGGQGTVLASKLIAKCAMNSGLNARTAETIGMAQRGGCVVSHVRIGEEIHSPLIPAGQADIIIGFEPAEAVRKLNYLKKGGTVVVNKTAVKPATDSLGKANYDSNTMLEFLKKNADNVIIIDGDTVCRECGSAKVLNIVLLGAAVGSGVLGIKPETVIDTIKETLPEKVVPMNINAFEKGMKLAERNV